MALRDDPGGGKFGFMNIIDRDTLEKQYGGNAPNTGMEEDQQLATRTALDTPTPPMPPTREERGTADAYTELAEKRAAVETPDFTGYQPTAEAPELTEGREFITPEATVEGRISALIDPESELMKSTVTRAREQAAGLGMGRSAAAIQAGQAALIGKAQQIAEVDAQTVAKAQLAQQTAENQQRQIQLEAQVAGDLNVQKTRLAEESNKINQSFELAKTGLDQQAKTDLTNLQKQWDQDTTKLQLEMQTQMQQADIDAKTQMSVMNQANDMMNNYQITVQQLMSNDAFLNNLAEAGVSQWDIYNDMFQTVQSSLRFSGQAAGIYDNEYAGWIDTLTRYNMW